MKKKTPIYTRGEIGALSLIINDPAILATQVWKPEYFALEAHRNAFEAMSAVYARTGELNEFLAISELERSGNLERHGGEDAFIEIFSAHKIMASDVAKDMANDYRRELMRFHSYRETLKIWDETENDVRSANANLQELSERIAKTQDDKLHSAPTAKEIAIELVQQMQGEQERKCFPTGLLYLDRTLKGGMHGGELMTVASESGGGKSIFMVQAALANIIEGHSVAFFSLEMDRTDIFSRIVSCHAGIPIRTADEYKTSHTAELHKITPAIMELQKKPLTIIDDLLSLDEILAECKRLNSLGKADVIIVDYLQIVENECDNREQSVSDIARRFKNLATRLKAPVITGSQINDDGKLRESRAIKQHSNQVIYIKHRDEKSCVFVDKNRRGPRNYQFGVTMNGEISKLIIS